MYKVVPVHMVLPSGSIWSFDPVNGEWCTHSMSTRTWCTWRHRGLIKPGVHIFLFSRQANFMFQNISHPSHLLPCSAPYLSYSILESITEKLISQQHQSVFLHCASGHNVGADSLHLRSCQAPIHPNLQKGLITKPRFIQLWPSRHQNFFFLKSASPRVKLGVKRRHFGAGGEQQSSSSRGRTRLQQEAAGRPWLRDPV